VKESSVAARQRTKVGVLVINFGEPAEATREEVEPFLERIFLQNAGLEPSESARDRAKKLARDRAPGLIEEYERIGGSPLNEQAERQAAALQAELRARDGDVTTYSAFQFTEPSIAGQVATARDDGIDVLVALPVYPLCGQSTTVAAIESTKAALAGLDWSPRFAAVSGWHHHPGYERMRVVNVRRFTEAHGLDLDDPGTLLYFSVHGTPLKYLEEGNRYDRYVEEHCRGVARELGATRYGVGFQNHANRGIAWTQPDNEDRIREAPEKRLVVVPISFMHEQSETLAELDHELRVFAEGLGKEFYRVPVPHDAEEFIVFLADLVDASMGDPEHAGVLRAGCRCAPLDGVRCTNGHRELAPSPYARDLPASPDARDLPASPHPRERSSVP